MTEAFGRYVQLTVGPRGGVGTAWSDLWISGSVSMDDTAKPNKARIKVTNPDPALVAAALEPGAYVSLVAGYGPASRGLLFRGSPMRGGVEHKPEKPGTPGTVLEIEAEDGGHHYRRARVEKTWAGDTPLQDVISDLVVRSGHDTGRIDLGAQAGVVLRGGKVCRGPVRDQLSELCRSHGLRWFVRDGAVFVLERAADTGERAHLFSDRPPAYNILDVPKVTSDGVEVRGLMAPGIRPRQPVRYEYKDVAGWMVARSVQFKFDTGHQGGEHSVTVKGVAR